MRCASHPTGRSRLQVAAPLVVARRLHRNRSDPQAGARRGSATRRRDHRAPSTPPPLGWRDPDRTGAVARPLRSRARWCGLRRIRPRRTIWLLPLFELGPLVVAQVRHQSRCNPGSPSHQTLRADQIAAIHRATGYRQGGLPTVVQLRPSRASIQVILGTCGDLLEGLDEPAADHLDAAVSPALRGLPVIVASRMSHAGAAKPPP